MKLICVISFILLLLTQITLTHGSCESDDNQNPNHHIENQSLKLKVIAISAILVAGALGVSFPLLGKYFKPLKPESNVFLVVKFFAAGVILATGFVHVFPDANESLENPCLGDHKAWGDFPLGYFVAMVAAVGVMILETMITDLFEKSHTEELGDKENQVNQMGDLENQVNHEGHVHVHTHTSNGHAHGPNQPASNSAEGLLRHQIVSLVLETGILIHSLIIGISLGVSVSPKVIKPLIVALSFHQMFEGMGLGSCIAEAQFKDSKRATMSAFFSLTTPIGIAIGIGISSIYDESSHAALIIQGVLNAASAGILIYMALVDLLAENIMRTKVQTVLKLQILAFVALIVGMGCMSLLAIWA